MLRTASGPASVGRQRTSRERAVTRCTNRGQRRDGGHRKPWRSICGPDRRGSPSRRTSPWNPLSACRISLLRTPGRGIPHNNL